MTCSADAVPLLSDRLRRLQDAIRQVVGYVAEMDRAAFSADICIQQAATFNLVILSEEAGRLLADHTEFLARHPQIAWRGIRDMRSRATCGPFQIDLNVFWSLARQELPDLLVRLKDVIADAERL